ncbi:MAG: ABC transporter permease [Fimbriimonadaceae bacterium]|nr:ABC transporter permease [Fimbriimonadaceae bacterium]QYK56880.1 MAG: ABC transporter permease [Fimbriimonadaceae bacterium]
MAVKEQSAEGPAADQVEYSKANPLSPTVFLRRNFAKTAPLVAVIVLAVMLIAGIVSIMNSIPLSIRTTYGYSRNYFGVSPRGDNALTPRLRSIIEGEAPVPIEPIMVCRASDCEVKSIVGPWRFVVLGLGHEDMTRYIDRLGGAKIEGRLPMGGEAPEAVVSEPVARNLGLKMGDTILGPDNPDSYSPKEVRVVGIAQMDSWMILVPIEYHRANHFPPIDLMIVMAKDPKQQGRLDKWAFDRLQGERARVFAFFRLERETDEMFRILYSILNVVIGLLVVVITIMMAMLINIYHSQRLQEFGLLQALGYTRKWLLRRTLGETALVVVVGWFLGVICAFGLLQIVKSILMDPRAFMLDPSDPAALSYTLPVPAAIFLAAAFSVVARFRHVDPVSIVERRLA